MPADADPSYTINEYGVSKQQISVHKTALLFFFSSAYEALDNTLREWYTLMKLCLGKGYIVKVDYQFFSSKEDFVICDQW